jgi:hypothetical protein
MSSPEKGIRSLFLLAAFGMGLIGALQVGLEFTRHRIKNTELDVLGLILWGGLAVLGLLLMVTSGSLARKITGEEDDDDLPPSEDGEG